MGTALLNAAQAVGTWVGDSLISVANGIGGVGSSIVGGTNLAITNLSMRYDA